MRQLNDITHERNTLNIMVELTSAFEGIASLHISQIKDQVQRSQKFFDDLWRIYTQIRVDPLFHFGRGVQPPKLVQKELLILLTTEGSFSGDVDQRLIAEALSYYKPERNDIIVVGQHGANQLVQGGVRFVKNFKLPTSDLNINATLLVAEVQKYVSTVVYYPNYISLTDQKIKYLELSREAAERGKNVSEGPEIISESNYIFEPSPHAVVDHLEQSMVQIMLGEIILESKLAQYASRFWAMHAAHERAGESYEDLSFLFNRAKRHYKDERIREIINSLRKVRS